MPLAAAQWTLTVPLLSGAVSTPILSRLGSGPRRRAVVIWTLTIVAAGGALTALPVPFPVLLIGRAAQGVGLGLTAWPWLGNTFPNVDLHVQSRCCRSPLSAARMPTAGRVHDRRAHR
ncbi:MFS transporter [Prescottella equi]|uniref:Integral membrane protein n=1 Tax=Rhodococcus hoagii (strain 103S) TaxID=685727 RepID=A0A3S5Y894_RHOH1|nr:MFS transporter [Prescottella equi]NKZ93662.1 MFS transporter [Prescottella equi]ORM08559.1 hypothetical protein A5N72_00325 [Prescottella equi]CBH48725.1 putative integral membrane protein [Prescottella equi 103S]